MLGFVNHYTQIIVLADLGFGATEHTGVFVMSEELGVARATESRETEIWASGTVDIRPVFRGLADGGMSGKELAHMLSVAPSTISKWRRGSQHPSEEIIQFLTLVLADVIGSKERTLDAMDDVPLAWRLGRESELAAMRQNLLQQEAINRVMRPTSLRDGARMFKNWIDRTHKPGIARPQSLRVVA